MGQSLILAIEELAPGMSEAFAAHNDAIAAIEEATNLRRTAYDVDAGDLDDPIAELDLVRFMVFEAQNALMDYSFIVPAEVNGNPAHRVFIFWNNTVYFASVETDDPNETFEVPPGGIVLVLLDDVDVFKIGEAGTFFRREAFQDSFFFSGAPTGAQLMWRRPIVEEATLEMDFVTPGYGEVAFTAQPDDTDTITIHDGMKTAAVSSKAAPMVTLMLPAVTPAALSNSNVAVFIPSWIVMVSVSSGCAVKATSP